MIMRDELLPHTSIAKRRALANPTNHSPSVKSILTTNGSTSPVLPPPIERFQPSSPDNGLSTPSPTRTSYALAQPALYGGPQKGKRLSLSLPIQTGSNSSYSRFTPPSSTSGTPAVAGTPTSIDKSMPSPTEAGGFLTALAAQERRVLELKEELHQAEDELEKLKKQWAKHENMRKRGEAKQVQQLQPLSPNSSLFSGSTFEGNESARRGRELERRRSMLSESRSPMKKVISGRHTKTLSLLADHPNNRQPFPQPADLKRRSTDKTRDIVVLRSATLPDMLPDDSSIPEEPLPNTTRHSLQGPAHKDALLQTGRQMASDFREGLWTFLDDIRQATVGEEGVNGTETRSALTVGTSKGMERQGSATKIRGGRKKSPGYVGSTDSTPKSKPPVKKAGSKSDGAGTSFWQEHGLFGEEDLVTPKQQKIISKVQPAELANDEDDSWENWDSPKSKSNSARWNAESSTSASEGGASPSANGSTPRTSTSSTNPASEQVIPLSPLYKGDQIPWPSLNTLSPNYLKRTASSFVIEWEKTLSAPGLIDGQRLGSLSRSPSPDKGRKDD